MEAQPAKPFFQGPGDGGQPRSPQSPASWLCKLSSDRKSQVRAAGRGKPRCQSQRSRQVPGPQPWMCAGFEGRGLPRDAQRPRERPTEHCQGDTEDSQVLPSPNCKATQSWVDGGPRNKGGLSVSVTLTLNRAVGRGRQATALTKVLWSHRGLLRGHQESRGAKGPPLLQSPRPRPLRGSDQRLPRALCTAACPRPLSWPCWFTPPLRLPTREGKASASVSPIVSGM